MDLVRYLLSKGANTEIPDAGGLKPIDLAGTAAKDASAVAEIRTLLQSAASKK